MNRSLQYFSLALAVAAALGLYSQIPAQPRPGSSHHEREAGEPAALFFAQDARDNRSSSKPSGSGAPDPATFVKQATQAAMAEMELAQLAEDKTQDPRIQSFAQRMVRDHSAANEELESLARTKGWAVPTTLDARQKATLEKLQAKSGADFDAAFARQMHDDHAKAVALFESATRSSDAELASWAVKTLPTLKQHQHLADALPTGVSKVAP